MAEQVKKRLSKAIDPKGEELVEFILSDDTAGSSSLSSPAGRASFPVANEPETTVESPADAPAAEAHSRAFLELAEPRLPALPRENRARLLMQSPTRLYFYWSVGKNPFHTLNRAIGGATGSYTLVLKLINLKSDTEEIHAIEPDGAWWFDVDADAEYRAEIGFYATNRPYVRVMYSNTIATPRKSPSPRSAESARWTVSADKFARVLDIAGFPHDAFDVALAGDDRDAAEAATISAAADFTGRPASDFASIGAEEIRFALLALASGVSLASLRGRISASLFAILEANISSLTSDDALAALREQFDFDVDEFVEEEETAAAVFGSSLVNFPRKVKRGRKLSELGPLGSSKI